MFTGATLLCGASFGSIWPHLVVLASELFGSANLGGNYMFFDGFCGALGTLLLANLLPRLFHSPEGNCDSHCFVKAHCAVGGFCVLGAVAAALVATRSATLYWRIGASREAARLRKRHHSRPDSPVTPWETPGLSAGLYAPEMARVGGVSAAAPGAYAAPRLRVSADEA